MPCFGMTPLDHLFRISLRLSNKIKCPLQYIKFTPTSENRYELTNYMVQKYFNVKKKQITYIKDHKVHFLGIICQ